jgi:hypothetical protein
MASLRARNDATGAIPTDDVPSRERVLDVELEVPHVLAGTSQV